MTYPKFRQSSRKKRRRATISRDLDGDDNDDADDAEDDDDDIDDDDDGQFFRNLPLSPPLLFFLSFFETYPSKPVLTNLSCRCAADDCTGGNSDNEYEDDGAENDYNDDAYD